MGPCRERPSLTGANTGLYGLLTRWTFISYDYVIYVNYDKPMQDAE